MLNRSLPFRGSDRSGRSGKSKKARRPEQANRTPGASRSVLSHLGRRTEAPPISWLMKMALDRPRLISLAAGFTDSASLPTAEARDLFEQILRSPRTGRAALQYGTTLGDPELRSMTAEHLRQQDAHAEAAAQHSGGAGCASPSSSPSSANEVSSPAFPALDRALDLAPSAGPTSDVYSPSRLIITSGSQQLLYMASEALCDPGDIVLVEDPTYFVFLGIMQSHGLQGRGLRMQEDGLDLAHLEQTLSALQRTGELRRVKLLYLVSYFQNPTGVSTSFQKKLGALELLRRYERAAGHPIYLLEDAAYRELIFTGANDGSALAAGALADRVIYMGTYSKPFATGVRVGYGMLPEPVFTAVERIKGNHDFGTSNLLQQLLARALASGRYEAHVAVLRARYRHKSGVMTAALREHFPGNVQWCEPRGGLYVWARLPRHLKTGARSKLFQAALKREVLYVPGELCYADDPSRPRPNHEMRLSFGGATLPVIREGIARLGRTLRAMPHRS
jgi:2-aminoadipate transaminase